MRGLGLAFLCEPRIETLRPRRRRSVAPQPLVTPKQTQGLFEDVAEARRGPSARCAASTPRHRSSKRPWVCFG
jgi:hypothetical protein